MTTMNNEDPADPSEMMFESFTIQHPYRAGTMEVVPAASMREAIAAERERSHELLQAADHIRAGLEAKLDALSILVRELRGRLERVKSEPQDTMSDSKAVSAMVRHAKLGLQAIERLDRAADKEQPK